MNAVGITAVRARSLPALAGEREYVRCDLCGADDTDFLFQAQDTLRVSHEAFSVVRCRCCGLAYLNPRPTPTAMEQYYSADYFASFAAGALPTNRARILVKRIHSRLTRRLSHRIESLPPGQVLDVGCGDGRYLELFRALGWTAYGLDPSRVAIERARQRGLDVFHGDLFAARVPDRSFDLVLMRYVIENMPNPSAVLREVQRVLKDDGTLFLTAPSLDSPMARLLKGHFADLDAPRHLHFFTAPTVTRMLESTGFRVERLAAVPNSQIRGSLDRMSRGRLKGLLRNRWLSRLLWTAEFPLTVVFAWLGLNCSNMEMIARKKGSRRLIEH